MEGGHIEMESRSHHEAPPGAEAVTSCPVTKVVNQQSLLAAVLDRTLREVQKAREVQDGSGTNGTNWHNELFPFSDAEELVEIILVPVPQNHWHFTDLARGVILKHHLWWERLK